MAIPLILCRLKDDHSVIHEIGETALIYFPDWEPVPDDHRELIEAQNNMTAPPDPEPASSEGPQDEDPAPDEKPDEEPGNKVAEHKRPASRKAAGPAAKDKE